MQDYEGLKIYNSHSLKVIKSILIVDILLEGLLSKKRRDDVVVVVVKKNNNMYALNLCNESM